VARKLAFDPYLYGIPIALTLFGLLMVYSASSVISLSQHGHPYHYLLRQAIAAVIGFAAMSALMFVPYSIYRHRWVSGILLGVTVALLAAVLLLPPVQGVRRWLPLGPLNAQPSEIAKVTVIIFLAAFLDRQRLRLTSFRRTLLPCLAVVGQVALLVALEPDLGTCALLLLTSLLVLFMGGVPYRQIAAVGAVCLLAVGALALSADYRMARLVSFLDPEADPQGAGFQTRQSLLAISSGGLTGRSLGEGQQKHFFLPEPHTDFIFSVIAEEAGLVGTLMVLAGFAAILWRGLRAAARAPDRLGSLLAAGLTLTLGVGALVNIAVALALLPTKGLPLPFLSYGGSCLVMSLAATGILLNVSQHSA
jgi:cell division protein FtsW